MVECNVQVHRHDHVHTAMRSNSWFEAYTTFWKWKTAIQRVAIERPDPACAHFKVTPRRVTTCRTRNNKMSLSDHLQGLPCALAVSPTRLGNVHAPFRSFRASLIGINNITAGRAPGFAVASFLVLLQPSILSPARRVRGVRVLFFVRCIEFCLHRFCSEWPWVVHAR